MMRLLATLLVILLAAQLTFAQKKKPRATNTTRIVDEACTEFAKEAVLKPVVTNDLAHVFRADLEPQQATSGLCLSSDALIVPVTRGILEYSGTQVRTRRADQIPGHIQVLTVGPPTKLRNVAREPMTIYLVEPVKGLRTERASCGLDGDACESSFGSLTGSSFAETVIFETPALKASEMNIDPGALVDAREHPNGRLRIALSDLNLRAVHDGQEAIEAKQATGDADWAEPDGSYAVRNLSETPAHYVVLEFKKPP